MARGESGVHVGGRDGDKRIEPREGRDSRSA